VSGDAALANADP